MLILRMHDRHLRFTEAARKQIVQQGGQYESGQAGVAFLEILPWVLSPDVPRHVLFRVCPEASRGRAEYFKHNLEAACKCSTCGGWSDFPEMGRRGVTRATTIDRRHWRRNGF